MFAHRGSTIYMFRQLQQVRWSLELDSAKMFVHAFVISHVDYCIASWPRLHITWPTGFSGSWMRQRDLFRVLASSTSVYRLCCTTICTGSMFQSASTTNWTLLCVAACRRKLRDTWPTVAHQFRKLLAVNNYMLSQLTTPYCAMLSAAHIWVPGLFFCFLSYQIVSIIQHWVLTVFGNT